jgi:lipid A 3-O-deacylase
VGATSQGDMTYRIGLSFDWDKKWLESSTGYVTVTDAAYTYWEGGDASGAHSLSFSPVFTYEFSGFTYTPYIEAGIGLAAFSKTDVGDQRLGSSVNFEDRIGFGLKLPGEQKSGSARCTTPTLGSSSPTTGSSRTRCSTARVSDQIGAALRCSYSFREEIGSGTPHSAWP